MKYTMIFAYYADYFHSLFCSTLLYIITQVPLRNLNLNVLKVRYVKNPL